MLSVQDRLIFCTALLRLSGFPPAELALRTRRKLRLTLRFLESAPHLVQLQRPRGYDADRPLRETWSVIEDRSALHREIELLREASHALPDVGELFAGVDRLLRDVMASEHALHHLDGPDGSRATESELLDAQRCGIDHALLDIEVAVAGAVRARRKANGTHVRIAAVVETAPWMMNVAAPLLDWSSASGEIVADNQGQLPRAPHGASQDQLTRELERLVTQDPLDLASIRLAVTSLRNLRASWEASPLFGETLCAEFRQLLRQPYGRHWLGPLAVIAAALSETACAHSLFEGLVMSQDSAGAQASAFPVVTSALARLAFETHLEGGKNWVPNSAASMCQYLLIGQLAPMETLLAATGSLLNATGDLDHTLTLIANSIMDLPRQESAPWAASLSRTVWLALFLQIGRRSPLRSIPSLAELPGYDGLFDTLLDRNHEGVIYRLVPSHSTGKRRGEHYELRPGRRIEALLTRRFGDSELCLEMPVSHAFERRRAAATAPARWNLTAASPTSFLGELEAAASRSE